MKKLLRLLTVCFSLALVCTTLITPPIYAADFRAGDEIRITDTNQTLVNPYIFGGAIQVDSPIANELTLAGGDIIINSNVEGSALIAGGNITLAGSVGNNARIAGGDITIDGPIANDLVIAGGNIRLTENATIGGDLIFAGGKLQVDGPVAGKVMINGGDITLNNSVGGNVSGEIEALTLGSGAKVAGNLSYESPKRAEIAQGATISGRTDYQLTENDGEDDAAGAFLTTVALYKLVTDIILSLLFVYFFRRALMAVVNRMRGTPLRSGAIGFGYIALVPLAGIFFLFLIWLGLATYLFYFLTLIVGIFIVKLFLGWAVLHWWNRNNKHAYELDWKAAIVGPILLFILLFIPVFGWLAIAILLFMALGALLEALIQLNSDQSVVKNTTKKR
ncbi:MAG: hypothetical protein H0W89_02055 [Candidatus Levybacteria bacterium]|nr:hypothetical protein [Candidatus Levybacteria bacterium]